MVAWRIDHLRRSLTSLAKLMDSSNEQDVGLGRLSAPLGRTTPSASTPGVKTTLAVKRRIRSPGLTGNLPRGDVEPVPDVDAGDGQNQRAQLLLVEVVGRYIPDLVRHRIRTVGDAGRRLGQSQRGRFASLKKGASRQAATAKMRSSVSPSLRAICGCCTAQTPQPLI